MNLFFTIFQGLIFLFFFLGTLYLLVFAIAGLFYRPPKRVASDKLRKFAVFIPGYKEDNVIVEVAKKALEQSYPSDRYEVIVIADQFQSETLDQLRRLPIYVQEVHFEKSSKAKSLNWTMAQLPENYDVALILDADNVMAPNVLQLMNEAFNNGSIAVQGHRLAKNTNTHYAVLDALSEEINNHIFRKGHRVLGFSSALIGSGMAFDYILYKRLMNQIESFGEDKELEHKLLKNKVLIEYLDDALVFDEKISKSKVFVNQRTRWIANQLNYATSYLGEGVKELLKGNFDFFDKIIQHLIPPRIFMLGFLTVFAILSLIINPMIWNFLWISQWLLCLVALVISVPKRFYSWKTFRALIYLPFGFLLMLVSLFKVKSARKGFVHTTHTYNQNTNS